MDRLIAGIDRFTEAVGRTVAWLTLAMMAITCLVVVLRYGFGIGSIALQETVTYLHGVVFMLGIAYALKHDAHVRVDVLYSRLPPRRRALVDLTGHLLFLLPFCAFVVYASWDYTLRSWHILEGSREVGGLPAVFVLKTLIPLMAVTLALQGCAEILRCFETLTGRS